MDMNSLSPTMPTSPLSMINQVKFEDEPDLKDLFITVDDPESHVTTIETFITYRVATQVRVEGQSPEHVPVLGPRTCILLTVHSHPHTVFAELICIFLNHFGVRYCSLGCRSPESVGPELQVPTFLREDV